MNLTIIDFFDIAHEPNPGCYGYFYYWLHWRLWIQWSWRLWIHWIGLQIQVFFVLSLASEKSWHHFSNSLINFKTNNLLLPMFEYNAMYMYQPTICKTTVWLKWTFIYVCRWKKRLKINCRVIQQVLDCLSSEGRQNEPFCSGYHIHISLGIIFYIPTYWSSWNAYSFPNYCNTNPTK